MDQEKLDKQEKQDKQEKAQYKQQDKGMRIQLNQADIPPRTIKSRHIEAWIIFFGLDANKPTTGTQNVQCYFAFDTKKVYFWNPLTKTFNYTTLT